MAPRRRVDFWVWLAVCILIFTTQFRQHKSKYKVGRVGVVHRCSSLGLPPIRRFFGRRPSHKVPSNPNNMEEVLKMLEQGELDGMLEQELSKRDDLLNATEVFKESEKECFLEMAAEKQASEELSQAGSNRYANGTTYQGYKWEQFEDSFFLKVPLDDETSSRDLDVKFDKTTLKVLNKRKTDSAIVQGTFRYTVIPSECSWVIETNKSGSRELLIYVTKDQRLKTGETQPPKVWIGLFDEDGYRPGLHDL
ncbi:hypothetical protein AAMO2058_001694200 [Amorphochlora amoebiformis]